jgi:type I restriction enzyme R subunit
LAREKIDGMLTASGWAIQNANALNLAAGRGIAVREFPLKRGFGTADYLLYVDKRVVGVVEAKKEGDTLTGVEVQTEKYGSGLPDGLPAPVRPLPFLYQSTGIETRFTDARVRDAASRDLFAFHRPETLAAELGITTAAPGQTSEVRKGAGVTMLGRLRTMPPLVTAGMRDCQIEAIASLERSLAQGRRRSLLQMQTGSGKTYTAVASTYRLIKYGGAKRVLFLVDRGNLGKQTLKEFQGYVTPDDGRKFTELYNVQLLASNKIDPVAKVVITTIQRLYAILQGRDEDDPVDEEVSLGGLAALQKEPLPVTYQPHLPVEYFDFVWTDECHRSIYNLWRGVLEYFDASLIGLTATPSKQTLGFFNQNLVMEYGHARAVADQVNVDFSVYRIRTRITEEGGTVEAGLVVDKRDRKTRKVRWQELDDDLTYAPNQLDRAIVVPDQIRTVIRAFRDRMLPETFPDRNEVPKTLIFAKDDSHADDIVKIVREEFGKGNQFCEKITYRSSTARIIDPESGAISYQSTNLTPESLLSSFRTAYYPRIAVTVDMIATGTDIKPLEIVFFMRDVMSANYFEQMKGRGCRTIGDTELRQVTPGEVSKTRYLIVDAVGVTDRPRKDSVPLDRQPTVPLKTILSAVGAGSTDPEVVSTLAGRLSRLDKVLAPGQRTEIERLAGKPLGDLVKDLVSALDLDAVADRITSDAPYPEAVDPEDPAFQNILALTSQKLIEGAVAPFLNPELRIHLLNAQQDQEQTVAHPEQDELLFAGASEEATERARNTITSFREYLEEHRAEIEAIGLVYAKRRGVAPTLRQLKELANGLSLPPRAWTPERLWQAYETLERSKVRGHGGKMVTDLVSLIRFALEEETILAPFGETVDERFTRWLAAQEASGPRFTEEQRRWLEMIRDAVKTSLTVDEEDFDYTPFIEQGGRGRAYQVFGEQLAPLLKELNEVLVL